MKVKKIKAEKKCPKCFGRGLVRTAVGLFPCYVCNGKGTRIVAIRKIVSDTIETYDVSKNSI